MLDPNFAARQMLELELRAHKAERELAVMTALHAVAIRERDYERQRNALLRETAIRTAGGMWLLPGQAFDKGE